MLDSLPKIEKWRRPKKRSQLFRRGQFEWPPQQIGRSSDLSNGDVTKGFLKHAPNNAYTDPNAYPDATNSEERTKG